MGDGEEESIKDKSELSGLSPWRDGGIDSNGFLLSLYQMTTNLVA